MWLAEQIYVIVSRVRHLGNVHFVGEKTHTLHVLKSLLTKRSQYDLAMTDFLEAASSRTHGNLPTIDLTQGAYLPSTVEVPHGPGPFLYYFQSTKSTSVKRIGHTDNLRRALALLNRLESDTDCIHQPFALMSFAHGAADYHQADIIVHDVHLLIAVDTLTEPTQIQQAFKQACQNNIQANPSLIYVHCCTHRLRP